jgi:hypothetical protein
MSLCELNSYAAAAVHGEEAAGERTRADGTAANRPGKAVSENCENAVPISGLFDGESTATGGLNLIQGMLSEARRPADVPMEAARIIEGPLMCFHGLRLRSCFFQRRVHNPLMQSMPF